jgi:hypothetical protein
MANVSEEGGWRAVHVDDVETVSWRYSELTWRPLRHALGAHSVGIAAFTAIHEGQEVVEGHVETRDGRGHEEIYIVLRGRAIFEFADGQLEAPAGTCVCVSADAYRRATAAEADTVVVAIGREADFEVSTSEWIERARPFIRSDPERARAIVDELRAEQPESRGLAVAEALLLLGSGQVEESRRILQALLADKPSIAEALLTDPDLGALVAHL